jgi:glutamyl-tRNA synthetase
LSSGPTSTPEPVAGNTRGRYAPSPTGPLHLGNLRTALLAWLSARSSGGEFLLRIEDLDTGRSRNEWVAIQLKELTDIGIDWDAEPVRQSERHGLYEAALGRLRELGLTYECFCTRREILEAASAPHGDLPEGAYPGTCASLTVAEIAKRRASGRPPALRVRAGAAAYEFEDRLCGPVSGRIDDFVVRRNDGDFGYNLAVVVDDSEQGVTEVVRGADLLETTGRQLWLCEKLGLTPPSTWVHAPLMLGEDGTRLAKRHGSVTLEEQVQEGVEPRRLAAQLLESVGLAIPSATAAPDGPDPLRRAALDFSWDRVRAEQ